MATTNPAVEVLKKVAPVALPDALYEEISAAYDSPLRAYHTLSHVEEVAAWFAQIQKAGLWKQPAEVWLAVLYHDAVYEPGRGDNEARSAELARQAIARHQLRVDAGRVAQLIELTAQHGKLHEVDDEAALFLDCDMAILGSDAMRFAEYEAGIAAEYAVIPRDAYLAGRNAFLTRLREAPRIFLSDVFHRTLDWRARANLCRSLGLAEVVQAGDPVLRKRAVEVDPAKIRTAEMQALVRRMIDAMRAAPGVGLAAPPIGIGLRVFVLEDRAEYVARVPEEEKAAKGRIPVGPRVFFNPTLKPIGEAKVGFVEGCLSVSGWGARVERFVEVEVSGVDENGLPTTMRASGWPARILQHELDHLEGTLYIDRMDTRTFSTVENMQKASE